MPSVSVNFNGQEIMQVELTQECYVIGRQEGCDIHIDNLGISRQHARLVRDGSLYRLEDMNSSNGCFVNGKSVRRYNLNDSDVIAIGKYELRYSGEVSAEEENTISHLAGQSNMGGSVNTMEMDGDAIRRRLEEMRKSNMGEPASGAHSGGGVSSIGEAELRASRYELDLLQRRLRRMQVFMFLLLLIILGLGILLFMK